ncbi:hypothetical protein [Actinophytocola sp. NPDC049390]|uniref:hypothetical protein n=1 Tax=Actinophytocola sp. NPDC049390 TaxID=3363894 RepID=UPI0037B1A894
MNLVGWLVVGVNGLVLLSVVALAIFDRKTFSTPEELAAVARRVAARTRDSWDLDRRKLSEPLAMTGRWTTAVGVVRWRPGLPRPTVGRLTPWWATDGISDSIDTVRLALDVDGQRDPVVLEEYLHDLRELQPGMLVPIVDPGDGKGMRLALDYPADQLGLLLADYRRDHGLLDEHQHAAWTRGRRQLAEVLDVRPTGRVLADSVEVAAVVRVAGEPLTAVGFVRPEEASAMRRSRQVPVCVLTERPGEPVLGWFPF